MSNDLRVIAVDWSGDKGSGQLQRIWLAEVIAGEITRLDACWTRQKLIDHLIKEAETHENLIVGFDFAFSFPAPYCARLGASDHLAFWRTVRAEAARWLHRDSRGLPFWGWRGSTKPTDVPLYRTTEQDLRQGGFRPSSVFQIGGEGAVGTGSIRGISHLLELSEAGFSIWPFDPPRLPLVVEIFPTALLLSALRSSTPCARERYLLEHHPGLAAIYLGKAIASDDAFDAAVSALAMWEYSALLLNPEPITNDVYRLEGKIWTRPVEP